jgi:Ca2+-binding RTX toxin-like protein
MMSLLVGLAALALPGSAFSAEVSLNGNQLRFLAEEGEQNAVEVRVILAAYEVTDFGTAVTAGAGCRTVGPNTARCPSALVTSVVVTTGDHSDSVDLASLLPEEAASSLRIPSVIHTGPDTDRVMGGLAADTLEGGTGGDTLQGNEGGDTLRGGPDDDLAEGGPGADRVFGKEGNDILKGEAGSDRLNGGDGDDTLDGGPGGDFLEGGDGNDTLMTEDGETDTLRCGSGIDGRVGDLQLDKIDCEARPHAASGVGDDQVFTPRLHVRMTPRGTNRRPKFVEAWLRGGRGRYSARIRFLPKGRVKARRRCVSRNRKVIITRRHALRRARRAKGSLLHASCTR